MRAQNVVDAAYCVGMQGCQVQRAACSKANAWFDVSEYILVHESVPTKRAARSLVDFLSASTEILFMRRSINRGELPYHRCMSCLLCLNPYSYAGLSNEKSCLNKGARWVWSEHCDTFVGELRSDLKVEVHSLISLNMIWTVWYVCWWDSVYYRNILVYELLTNFLLTFLCTLCACGILWSIPLVHGPDAICDSLGGHCILFLWFMVQGWGHSMHRPIILLQLGPKKTSKDFFLAPGVFLSDLCPVLTSYLAGHMIAYTQTWSHRRSASAKSKSWKFCTQALLSFFIGILDVVYQCIVKILCEKIISILCESTVNILHKSIVIVMYDLVATVLCSCITIVLHKSIFRIPDQSTVTFLRQRSLSSCAWALCWSV